MVLSGELISPVRLIWFITFSFNFSSQRTAKKILLWYMAGQTLEKQSFSSAWWKYFLVYLISSNMVVALLLIIRKGLHMITPNIIRHLSLSMKELTVICWTTVQLRTLSYFLKEKVELFKWKMSQQKDTSGLACPFYLLQTIIIDTFNKCLIQNLATLMLNTKKSVKKWKRIGKLFTIE